jgi:hypothetical protein
MPAIFKYMASVTVWVLFVFGLAALVAGFARAFGGSSLPMVSAYFGYGIISLFLSVVCARLRKMLD